MPSYATLKRLKDDVVRTRITENLLSLRTDLDQRIPAKTATDTLLLATWNIRKFGDNKSAESLQYLAEIISRFDLIAVQEVVSSLEGLQRLVSLLGHNWDFVVTDSTEGTSGGSERMAFIYDKCKVFFRKMAGELVLPQSKLIPVEDEKMQFARTPFSVAFQAGWFRFILTTVHIFYGKDVKVDQRRLDEITAIAKFIKERAKKEDENYILLGDFNIFGTEDATMKALEKQGFYIPESIRACPSDYGKTKHYDQIAFKLKIDPKMTVFSEGVQRAGTFDFFETVYRPQDMDIYREFFDEKNTAGKTEAKIAEYYLQTWRTFQMSDHLPMWIELKIDFSNQCLEKLSKPTV